MRILKITLIAVVLITFGILVGIGFVWRELAFTTHTIVPAPDATDITPAPANQSSSTGSVPTPAKPATLAEPVTVKTSDLPKAQRTVLETLGMDDASITITPQMVSCAIEGLGAARVTEIQNGDAPSLAEGLTLIACMKK